MVSKVKRQEGEDYTEADLLKVIKLLNADKPITKKTACAMLRISYNTARLKRIIESYIEEKERIAKLKKANRTIAVSKEDESYVVTGYLEGQSLADISDIVYRSIPVIKRILNKYNIPLRTTSNDQVILESPPRDDYAIGDLVFSAKYNSPAEIVKDLGNSVYRIWVFGSEQFACQPYYEIGDMREAQKELGIKIKTMEKEEIVILLNEGLRNARKRDKK